MVWRQDTGCQDDGPLGPGARAEVSKRVHAGVVRIARDKGVTAGSDAGGHDGGGDRHPSSDRQYFYWGTGFALTRIMRKITTMAGTVGTKPRDRTRSVKLRLLEIGRVARAKGPINQDTNKRYRQLLDTTSRVVGQARRFSEETAQGMCSATPGSNWCWRACARNSMHDVARQAGDEANEGTYLPRQHAQRRKAPQLFEPSTVIRKGTASPTSSARCRSCRKRRTRSSPITKSTLAAMIRSADRSHRDTSSLAGTHAVFGGADAAFYSRQERGSREGEVKRVCIPNRSTKSLERKREQRKRWFRNGQKVGAINRRPDQRGQAATRSRSMPLSRLCRHQPLGRARRHRRIPNIGRAIERRVALNHSSIAIRSASSAGFRRGFGQVAG